MSDEQHKDEPEVEGHRMKHPHANDEPDVELHRMKHPHASDEPRDEMESDDEVEAHRLRASRYTKN
jgi:hypothetical protein